MQQYELLEHAIQKSFSNWKNSNDSYGGVVLDITSSGVRSLPTDRVGSMRSSHAKGLAVDVVLSPAWAMPLFFTWLSDHLNAENIGVWTNIFLSLQEGNRHLHFDWDFYPDNLKGRSRKAFIALEKPFNQISRVYPLTEFKYASETDLLMIKALYGSPFSSGELGAKTKNDDKEELKERLSKNDGCAYIIVLIPIIYYWLKEIILKVVY